MPEVTDKTADAMSLAHALGYRPKAVEDYVYMYRYGWTSSGKRGHDLKLRGRCKRCNMLRWLQSQGHDLTLVKERSDMNQWG